VKEIDGFVDELRKTSFFKSVSALEREYHGDVTVYEDKVVVTQEVRPGSQVSVVYRDGKIVISFDDKVYEHDVGCLVKDSINAFRKFGVVVVEGRRCGHAEEDKGSDSEKEGGEDRGDGGICV